MKLYGVFEYRILVKQAAGNILVVFLNEPMYLIMQLDTACNPILSLVPPILP